MTGLYQLNSRVLSMNTVSSAGFNISRFNIPIIKTDDFMTQETTLLMEKEKKKFVRIIHP